MNTPRRIPFLGRLEVALPTGQEAAAFDRWAMDRLEVPGAVLMENAGREAGRLLQRLVPRGRVAVVAGPGNNGGDGIVLARTLTAWGRQVHLFVVGDRPRPDPLLHGWRPAGLSRIPREAQGGREDQDRWVREVERSQVVVDALLGTGIRGAPRPPEARVIEALNRTGLPVLALDVPSGVDADTGAVPGAAIQARWTVGFGAPKRGTLLHPGRAAAGRLLAVEMGFPPWRWGGEGGGSARLITPGWAHARFPRRALVTHKNAEGRLLLLAGSPGMAGAAILAAQAAQAAGAGYLRVATPPELRDPVQLAVPSAVWVDASQDGALADAVRASDAVAAGPGLGLGHTAVRSLRTVLAARAEAAAGPGLGAALLLDADALNLLAKGELGALDPGPAADGPLLLTPHPGEARRLEGAGFPSVGDEADHPDPGLRAAALSRATSATVLLKGNPSVVAVPDPTLPVLFSATSSSSLARAGMGDVLTGVAGALLARRLPPDEAAGVALHLTGVAAWPEDHWGHHDRTPAAPLPETVAQGVARALEGAGDGTSDLDEPSLILDLPAPW